MDNIKKSDYDKLSFSTRFRYENIHLKGHKTLSLGTNGYYNYTEVNIPHGLGYAPYFKLYIKFNGDPRIFVASYGSSTYGIVGEYQIALAKSNSTNITVGVEGYPAISGGATIYYRIYKERQV